MPNFTKAVDKMATGYFRLLKIKKGDFEMKTYFEKMASVLVRVITEAQKGSFEKVEFTRQLKARFVAVQEYLVFAQTDKMHDVCT